MGNSSGGCRIGDSLAGSLVFMARVVIFSALDIVLPTKCCVGLRQHCWQHRCYHGRRSSSSQAKKHPRQQQLRIDIFALYENYKRQSDDEVCNRANLVMSTMVSCSYPSKWEPTVLTPIRSESTPQNGHAIRASNSSTKPKVPTASPMS